MKKVTLIAHRSGPDAFPEQTVVSALEALKNGAEMVEIDTRFTSDGIAVISHDASTGRVFSEDKRIKEMTKDEFVSMKRKEDGFYGHTLTDYLDAGVKPLLIHVKEGGERIKQLADEVRFAGFAQETTFGVHSIEDARTAREYAPEIKLLAFMPSADDLDAYLETDVEHIRLWEAWITEERIKKIHDSGKDVWIMTGECDGRPVGEVTKESLAEVLSHDVDGVLVNKVNVIVEFLEKSKQSGME